MSDEETRIAIIGIAVMCISLIVFVAIMIDITFNHIEGGAMENDVDRVSKRHMRKSSIRVISFCVIGVCLFFSPLFYTLITGKAVDMGKSSYTDYGVTVCKEQVRTTHCTKGCWTTTSYYLIDEHGNRLDVDSQIYNSLVSIPECELSQ